MPAFPNSPPESESSLLRGAYSCYFCLKQIEPTFGSHTLVGFGILAGHCIEATLKCHLLQNGVDTKELRTHDVRHNLELLWQRAERLGPPIVGQPPEWVRVLNWGHDKPFQYRYIPHDYGLAAPLPSEFLPALFSIMEALRKKSERIL
jgi:hypothetical protein